MTSPPQPDKPTEAGLHEAALRHLGRYATSVAGLVRILDRRIDRWARTAAAEAGEIGKLREAARAVAARLQAAGAVDDRSFAAARARRLSGAGRSRRAIAAHLAARGTGREAALAALPDDPATELAAAVIAIRRRRFGAWRSGTAEAPQVQRELASLARAGFSEAVARSALALPREEAEALIAAARR